MKHRRFYTAAKTIESPESLRGIHPRKYTEEQQKQAIDFFAKMSLAELRKRQRITNEQIERAHEQKNTEAIENLQMVDSLLAHAVMKREFGED